MYQGLPNLINMEDNLMYFF